MRTSLLGTLAVALGCGCATTTAHQATATSTTEPAARPEAGVTAEQFEQIDDVFKRKTSQLHDCWQEEFDRTNDRKLQGDLTVAIVVLPSGKASNVKILRSTIASPKLQACVVTEVSHWTFPELQVPAPYSRMVHMGSEF